LRPRQSFFNSSVGSKYLIALSGLSLIGFLILHLAGNLLVFVSPEAFNGYSDTLIHNPLLIPAELSLLALFLLHAYKTVRLVLASRRARPDRYAMKKRAGWPSRKSVASSTMIASGLFLLLFVPLHLETFKYGPHYEAAQPGVRDLYRLVVEIYSRPGYVAFYLVSMLVVGLHLWHGVSSAFQTAGVDTPRWRPVLRRFGWVMAVVIAGGFMSIPVWIFLSGARP